jgi:competence protein ComEC
MPVIKLAFLDVGQGDTTIITCPDTHEAIVVDCVDSDAALKYLKREEITQLRGVIITHLHADHYKETADLLYSYAKGEGTLDCEVLAITEHVPNPRYLKAEKILNQWPPDRDGHSAVFEQPSGKSSGKNKSSLAKLYQWCQENKKKCQLILADSNVLLPIQGIIAQSLKILHPTSFDIPDLKRRELNDISIVLRVTGTGASALLTGDLEPTGWQYLKDQNYELKSDVLKFPHHGGAWSEAQTDDLLSVVQPSVVAISVGSNNGYDHPHTDVFTALQKRHDLRLFCTQATDKCQTSVQSERDNVIFKFEQQSRKDNSFFPPAREKHCPCSGSVIVELRDTPVIIQPNTAFHESLINVHFKKHKCLIRTIATAVGGEASTSSVDI